jgi:hypothetical protein
MTELIVTSQAADGYIRSGGAVTYTQARDGSSPTAYQGGFASFENSFGTGEYWASSIFLSFDTSSIGAGQKIDSVVLSLRGEFSNNLGTGYSAEVRPYDWGATLTSADYVPGASLSGLTLLASLPVASYADDTWCPFSSETAFKAAINMTGTTYLLVCHSDTTTNTEPVTTERMFFYMSDQGVGYEPKLTINHSASGFTGLTVTKLLNG